MDSLVPSSTPKKRKNEVPLDMDSGSRNWPAFIVLSMKNKDKKSADKINCFVLGKTIEATAGTVKQIKRLRSGDILVETSSCKFIIFN